MFFYDLKTWKQGKAMEIWLLSNSFEFKYTKILRIYIFENVGSGSDVTLLEMKKTINK